LLMRPAGLYCMVSSSIYCIFIV